MSDQGEQLAPAYPAAVEVVVAPPAQAQEVYAHVEAITSSHSSGKDVVDI
jgi:hypothetical protein